MDKRPYMNLFITVLILLLISFVTAMINQVVQLVNMASDIHPYFGMSLLVFFSFIGLAAVVSIALIIFKLEKPLTIPSENNELEYKKYILSLKNRLVKNKYLKESQYVWNNSKTDIESVNEALVKIDEESQRIIKRSAAGIFTTTAVSQNGSLDGIFVFAASIKLVWSISSLYNQRPAMRDMLKVYTNVFGTVLASRQIDDLDIVAEQLGQVLPAAITGTLGSAVPGAKFIASFVTDSILEGTINTLLILRIGLMTQYYCRSITKFEPRRMGRAASLQACKMLGEIISNNLVAIVGVWAKAAFNAIKRVPKGSKEYIMEKLNSRINATEGEAAITDND